MGFQFNQVCLCVCVYASKHVCLFMNLCVLCIYRLFLYPFFSYFLRFLCIFFSESILLNSPYFPPNSLFSNICVLCDVLLGGGRNEDPKARCVTYAVQPELHCASMFFDAREWKRRTEGTSWHTGVCACVCVCVCFCREIFMLTFIFLSYLYLHLHLYLHTFLFPLLSPSHSSFPCHSLSQTYIESENKRLERDPSRCFDAREINVRMEYRFCPNMIVIDTPGMLHPPKVTHCLL
jgi:hypothetical protein